MVFFFPYMCVYNFINKSAKHFCLITLFNFIILTFVLIKNCYLYMFSCRVKTLNFPPIAHLHVILLFTALHAFAILVFAHR